MDNGERTPQAVPMEHIVPEKPERGPQAIRMRTSERRSLTRRRFLEGGAIIGLGLATTGAVLTAENALQGMRPEEQRTSARPSGTNARETSLRGLMGKALEPVTAKMRSAWENTAGKVIANQDFYDQASLTNDKSKNTN